MSYPEKKKYVLAEKMAAQKNGTARKTGNNPPPARRSAAPLRPFSATPTRYPSSLLFSSPCFSNHQGEQKANVLSSAVMAKRPASIPNDAMTREQLKQLEHNLGLLSPHIVKEKYRQAVDRCRFLDLPTPRVVQELVTAWKVLWRWRK